MNRSSAVNVTREAYKLLRGAFPEAEFTVETGVVLTRHHHRIVRGHVMWVDGPAVAAVQEVLVGLELPEGWTLDCLRRYSPAWAEAMAANHRMKVKISTSGYDRTALLHPYSRTEEGEAELARFAALLNACSAPRAPKRRTDPGSHRQLTRKKEDPKCLTS